MEKLQTVVIYYFVLEGHDEYEGQFIAEGHDESPDGNGEYVYFFDIGESARLMVRPWEILKINII